MSRGSRVTRCAQALSPPGDAIVAAATLALTLHVERVVLAGVVLAVAVHLWRELCLPATLRCSLQTLWGCRPGAAGG